MAASGAAGGVGSVLGGGKFSNGALTGAFGRLFNEEAARRPLDDSDFQANVKKLISGLTGEGARNLRTALGGGYEIVQTQQPSPRGDYYWTDAINQRIFIAPDIALLVTSGAAQGQVLPPSLLFEHELAHAAGTVNNAQAVFQRLQIPDTRFLNKEEYQVTTGAEARASRYYGLTISRDCYPCGSYQPY